MILFRFPPAGSLPGWLMLGAYILKLGKADHDSEPWQAAIAVLMMAAEGRGPMDHARIGILKAINRRKPRAFDPSRKDPHWGKRKLKRDM